MAKKVAKKKAPARKPKRRLPTKPKRGAFDIHEYITLFYGPPGVGKTTFVNELANQDVLFISTDRGSRHIVAMREEVDTYQDVLDVLDLLEAPNAPKYDMVCIDHVDDFASAAEEYTLQELNIESLSQKQWGQGWKQLKNNIRHVISRLKKLGMGIVFISHETIKTVKVHGIDREIIQPDMPKTAWKQIIPLVDVVGYCGFRAMKKGGKRVEERVIYTQPTESVYAKDRTQRNKPTKGYEYLNGQKFRSTFKLRSSQRGQEKSKQQATRGRRARR